MTIELMAQLIFAAGVAQLACSCLVRSCRSVEMARAIAVSVLLHRQMYWVYGGYVVLSIVAFALLSLFNARELAGGSSLARGLNGFIAVFWGVRLVLQGVFDVKEHLTVWWLRAGYGLLTLLFAVLTALYASAAFGVAM